MPAWWNRGKREGAWWERSPASELRPPERPPSRRQQRRQRRQDELERSLWFVLVSSMHESERHPFTVEQAWNDHMLATGAQYRQPTRSQVEEALWSLVRRGRLNPWLGANGEWMFVAAEGWWKP